MIIEIKLSLVLFTCKSLTHTGCIAVLFITRHLILTVLNQIKLQKYLENTDLTQKNKSQIVLIRNG